MSDKRLFCNVPRDHQQNAKRRAIRARRREVLANLQRFGFKLSGATLTATPAN